SYEKMKEINPRIIYGSISGFGLTGPLANRPAYDIVAQAMSGMMSITGFPDSPPTKIGPSMGDNYSGAFLCIGILMALYKREKTGEGSHIDISMMDALFSVMENLVVDYTVTGEIPMRAGNADPSITPFDSFHAKDGDFVMGCGTDKMFVEFCDAIGKSYLYKDPRFDNNYHRSCNYLPDLKREIEEFTMTKTVAEMEELLVSLKIPVGRIQNIKEACEHPQLKERNMLWTVHQPGMDADFTMPGTPIKIHGEPDELIKPAPLLGEDNDAILGELGYSAEQIARFKEDGAV
ncbi:MAG: CoA transferase, partial [Firmicutes bacterium]|nr:CoA transferase [Bacillota bacterium]